MFSPLRFLTVFTLLLSTCLLTAVNEAQAVQTRIKKITHFDSSRIESAFMIRLEQSHQFDLLTTSI